MIYLACEEHGNTYDVFQRKVVATYSTLPSAIEIWSWNIQSYFLQLKHYMIYADDEDILC